MPDRANTHGLDAAAIQFLQTLHRIAEGDGEVTVNKWKVAADAHLATEDADVALQRLEHEGLVVSRAMGGGISITPRGVATADQALDAPARATQSDLAALRDTIADVRRALPTSGTGDDVRAEADADLATLEAQLQSPRPKRAILAATLDSLAAIATLRPFVAAVRGRFGA